jgi:hypothetical protein
MCQNPSFWESCWCFKKIFRLGMPKPVKSKSFRSWIFRLGMPRNSEVKKFQILDFQVRDAPTSEVKKFQIFDFQIRDTQPVKSIQIFQNLKILKSETFLAPRIWISNTQPIYILCQRKLLILRFPSNLFIFWGTGAWTQGLQPESLHQPYFCEGFFKIRSCRTICLDWLWTSILLISAF